MTSQGQDIQQPASLRLPCLVMMNRSSGGGVVVASIAMALYEWMDERTNEQMPGPAWRETDTTAYLRECARVYVSVMSVCYSNSKWSHIKVSKGEGESVSIEAAAWTPHRLLGTRAFIEETKKIRLDLDWVLVIAWTWFLQIRARIIYKNSTVIRYMLGLGSQEILCCKASWPALK